MRLLAAPLRGALQPEGLLTVSGLPDFFRGYLEEAGAMEAFGVRFAVNDVVRSLLSSVPVAGAAGP